MFDRLGLLWLALVGSPPALAQDVEVEAFTAPRSLDRAVPEYPQPQLFRGGEALVRVDFMVDVDGKAFDAMVVDSTGSDAFHAAALAALGESTFVPARRNGEAIVGSSTIMYRFDLEGGSHAASETFVNLYKQFQRANKKGDEADVEAALDALEQNGAGNHYENAYLNLAHYTYAQQHGSERDRLKYLSGALSISSELDDPVFLDDSLVRELRRALLPLQLRLNLFPSALTTYDLMVESGDEEGVAFFADTIAKVKALAHDDTEYSILLTIDESGAVWQSLYKRHVALTGGSGALAEISLQCEQKYIVFEVERDVAYTLPPEWGECSMKVVGDAGASFFLLQS